MFYVIKIKHHYCEELRLKKIYKNLVVLDMLRKI